MEIIGTLALILWVAFGVPYLFKYAARDLREGRRIFAEARAMREYRRSLRR